MSTKSHLNELERAGLVRVAQVEPDLEYLFRHALVQDAAYASMLRGTRQDLHAAIGETLERLYPDRLDELAPALARHYAEGGDSVRALAYYRAAGDHAAARYANEEAVAFYRQAVQLAREDSAGDPTSVVELYKKMGRVLEVGGHYEDAQTLYEEMAQLAAERGDEAMGLQAMLSRATLYVAPTSLYAAAQGMALAEEARTLAQKLGNVEAEAKAWWQMMLAALFKTEVETAIAYGEQSLALARNGSDRLQLAYTLHDLSRAYGFGRRMDEGFVMMEEAENMWRELGNLPMLADNLSSVAMLHLMAGDFEKGFAYSQEARQVSVAIGSLWGESYSIYMVGFVHYVLGNISQGIAAMRECISLAEQAGFTAPQVDIRAILSIALIQLGALDEARAELDTMQTQFGGREAMMANPEFHSVGMSYIQATEGDTQTALGVARAELKELSEQEISQETYISLLAVCETLLLCGHVSEAGEILPGVFAGTAATFKKVIGADIDFFRACGALEKGDTQQAVAFLREALSQAQAPELRRVQWRIEAKLAEVLAGTGDDEEAAALWAAARESLAYVLDHIEESHYRETYVKRPDVEAVLKSA